MDHIVKDSSRWHDSGRYGSLSKQLSTIHIGTVRSEFVNSFDQARYIVETSIKGQVIPIACSVMVKFGGVQNYEEFTMRSYRKAIASIPGSTDPAIMSADLKVGDNVVVACLQGNAREGIILGGLGHPARKEILKSGELAYASEFNGIEHTISKTGAYRTTFKAPIMALLDTAVPGTPILPQQVNPVIGGTYSEFSDDGSWTVNDNRSQFIKIDKSANKTVIKSGNITMTLDAISNLTSLKTLDLKVEAVKNVSIKGLQLAIGSSSFEVFDGLIKLIDMIGAIVPISPFGPCNSLNTTAAWPQIEQIKAMITLTKGSL